MPTKITSMVHAIMNSLHRVNRSVPLINYHLTTTDVRRLGYVHVLTGLVTIITGIVALLGNTPQSEICAGIWAGMSFILCGTVYILTSRSTNTNTVTVMVCVTVVTMTFATASGIISLKALFKNPQGQYGRLPYDFPKSIAVGVINLLTGVLEYLICCAGWKIAWALLASMKKGGEGGTLADPYVDSSQSSNKCVISWKEAPPRRLPSADDALGPPRFSGTEILMSGSPA